MDWTAIQAAVDEVFTAPVLAIVLASAAYGIFVGSIPGLTATMAVALLVPLTFFLDPIPALAAIVTTVTCSIFAGDIPGALVRIPGTPASAAYALDAYAMTRAGQPERSLGISLVFSVVGGLFGVAVLALAAPQLAKLEFTSFEYFWLCVLGLSCAALVTHGSRSKGVFSLMIGLLISTVGLSADHGEPRFAFHYELWDGIAFIPAMIGLFGLSEILRNVLRLREPGQAVDETAEEERPGFLARQVWLPLWAVVSGVVPLLFRRWLHVLRSSGIGTFVGMLPGAGADLAAWISYAVSKRVSKNPDEYGTGSREGLGDATAANNAALAGAWIPALVFGIPGDSVTAIAIGVLLMKDITPGSKIFTDEKQAVLVGSIFVTFVLANLLLLPLGLLAIRAGSLLIRIPRRVLLPLILVFCILGAYATSGNPFDIWVMLAMGLLGFVLEGLKFPLGPVVLGIILGDQLEHTFIQSLIKSTAWYDFFTRPAAALLAVACLALWFGPLAVRLWRRWRKTAGAAS